MVTAYGIAVHIMMAMSWSVQRADHGEQPYLRHGKRL
jgi:hypothetical protein